MGPRQIDDAGVIMSRRKGGGTSTGAVMPIKEQQWDVLGDLESPICEIAGMSSVCDLLIQHFHRQIAALKRTGLTGEQSADEADRAAAPLVFAVYQLGIMARELRKEYYAKIKQAR
jgi:hypothetical protein